MNFQGQIAKRRLQVLLAALPTMGGVCAWAWGNRLVVAASMAAFSAGLVRTVRRSIGAGLQWLAATLSHWLRFLTPTNRIVVVDPEVRTYPVPWEGRVMTVASEQRVVVA